MFHFLDPQGKGQIGLEEFNASLEILGVAANSKETELLLQRFTPKAGALTYPEFLLELTPKTPRRHHITN